MPSPHAPTARTERITQSTSHPDNNTHASPLPQHTTLIETTGDVPSATRAATCEDNSDADSLNDHSSQNPVPSPRASTTRTERIARSTSPPDTNTHAPPPPPPATIRGATRAAVYAFTVLTATTQCSITWLSAPRAIRPLWSGNASSSTSLPTDATRLPRTPWLQASPTTPLPSRTKSTSGPVDRGSASPVRKRLARRVETWKRPPSLNSSLLVKKNQLSDWGSNRRGVFVGADRVLTSPPAVAAIHCGHRLLLFCGGRHLGRWFFSGDDQNLCTNENLPTFLTSSNLPPPRPSDRDDSPAAAAYHIAPGAKHTNQTSKAGAAIAVGCTRVTSRCPQPADNGLSAGYSMSFEHAFLEDICCPAYHIFGSLSFPARLTMPCPGAPVPAAPFFPASSTRRRSVTMLSSTRLIMILRRIERSVLTTSVLRSSCRLGSSTHHRSL